MSAAPRLSPTERRKRLRLLSRPKDWQNENAFRKHVTAFAELVGYSVNFTYRSKTPDGSWRTNATSVGYPDLCCSKPGRLVFFELKMPGKDPTPAQNEWIARLQTVPGVDAYVVWPADWPTIVELLLEGDDELEADALFA